jgi:hypothetical protein
VASDSVASVADVERLVATARQLLLSGGALQSTAGGERIDGTEIVRALAPGGAAAGDAREMIAERSAATAVVRTAEEALRKAVGREGAASLSDAEVSNLQAIVHVLGRPATAYIDGRVQMPPDLGQNDVWRTLVATQRREIEVASAAVGQISRGGEILGTLWRLGDDLAVTNRHVVEFIVRDAGRAPQDWELDPALTVTADFNATRQPTTIRRFGVSALKYCAEEDDVDFAVVALTPGSDRLPAPLAVEFSPGVLGRALPAAGGATAFKGESVYVVGHPFRLVASQASATVFGRADGSKRWSPGLVTAVSSTSRALEHDCSTLGGNSGACVFEAQEHTVVALHVGGRGVDEKGRGVSNVAVAFSRLGGHRAETILRAGRV